MDPPVPWSAYAATYNRLANAGTGFQASGDFQNATLAGHQTTGQSQSNQQLILQAAAHTSATLAGQLGQGATFTPTGFLSPPSVGYDTVFSPLFHQKAAAHFRKQSGDSELTTLHPQGSYFDPQAAAAASGAAAWTHQANSQLPSPFGILPHESVVPNSPGAVKPATTTYESFNAAHFAAQSLNHINSHLTDFSKGKNTPRSQPSSATYNNSQQSCIVSSASASPGQGKSDYRVPQSPARGNTNYPNQRGSDKGRNFTSPPGKAPQPQQQHVTTSKPQPKVVVETIRRPESLETTQSSPISFALSYPTSANPTSAKSVPRPGVPAAQYVVNQSYRYNDGGEYHSRKTGSADSAYSSGSNGPDCNATVPRRPSPLQAHSQASPLGHAPSPAYPIYNSPSGVTQVTPPSPLDVSVSRTATVAYPSVITRAEGRWESEARAAQAGQRAAKYPAGYGVDGQLQRGIAERQQNYYDVPAGAEMTACRGDPMSIVKNLQNCNPGHGEPGKIEAKAGPKNRRKSGDKGVALEATPPELLTPGRVPPPAHHNNPASQQPQNGTYFEMERWNLTSSKIFPGHNQHQGLIAHHPPPLPYFAPFHLPPGHPQEYHPGDTVSTVNYVESYHHHAAEVKEENPKVVVPNVEEELKYLSQQAHAEVVVATQQNGTAATVLPPPIRFPQKKPTNDPNSGFMASYLKFLQGERDTSPPPQTRTMRKTWSRSRFYTPEAKPAVNNVAATTAATPNSNSNSIRPPSSIERKGNEKPYNPDDDPRFYPLPKSTAKRRFDDSDSSDDDSRKTYTQMKTVSRGNSLTGAKKHVGRPPGSKKHNSATDPLLLPPRREMSKRKAKEKTTIRGFLDKSLDDDQDVDDPDFVDSDTDPVWMPGAKGDSDDEMKSRKKKARNFLSKGQKRRPDDVFTSSDEERRGRKSLNSTRVPKFKTPVKEPPPPPPPPIVASTPNTAVDAVPPNPAALTDPDAICNKKNREKKEKAELTGEFVVIKSELHEEYPAIWRIDGKTLLQKYEPFDENGQVLYRNISTYSGWTAQNRHIYVTVPVRFIIQSRTETIVELLKDQMTFEDPELMERVMKDLEKYQDSFEVYIQTLISQALDSNFLSEIIMEKDEYFLSNVKTIDDVTDDHCRRLLNVTKWRTHLVNSFRTFPALNVMHDLPKDSVVGKICASCEKPKVSMRIQVYGQPYNPTTLDGCPPDPKTTLEKDFLMCSACGWRISLFNKATHQKYLMFIECAKRVGEKRKSDPSKDTTIILNELLADEAWLSQLFLDVRKSWAEIEKIEHLSCESNKQLLQNAVASAGIS